MWSTYPRCHQTNSKLILNNTKQLNTLTDIIFEKLNLGLILNNTNQLATLAANTADELILNNIN